MKKVLFNLFLFFICFTMPLFGGGKMSMQIFSNSFQANGFIPKKFTCDGKDISPNLKWSNFTENIKSFVIIMDDPDAPVGTWVHWVLYNIPPNINELPEGADINNFGAKQGKNSWGKNSYGGPCPPPGKPHRYFFKIYALDISTDFPEGLTKEEVLEKIENHIISRAEIMGYYKR